MLSFEMKPLEDETSELEVYMDKDGLQTLLTQLGFLQAGKTDHVHLMPESWGGYDLLDQPVIKNNKPIQHVKIYLSQTALKKN